MNIDDIPEIHQKDVRLWAAEKSLRKYEKQLRELTNELIELKKEKERRIYYQNIVYQICNMLEVYLGYTPVCGTVDNPTTEVQDTLKKVLK